MADTTGTAREEAERLVATVLAMASRSGLGGVLRDWDQRQTQQRHQDQDQRRDQGPREDQGQGRTRDRDRAQGPNSGTETGLTDMITGLVGQFLGGIATDPGAASRNERPGPEAQPTGHSRDADRSSHDPGDGPGRDGRDGGDGPGRDDRDGGAGPGRDGRDGGAGPGRDQRDRDDVRGAGQYGRGGADRHGRDSRGGGGFGAGWQAAGQVWEVLGRRGGWSTGSPECCVCPVCRAIAGMRDPSPERAERLATGAGDLASGVASLLRGLSVVTGTTGTSHRRKAPARPTATPDQAWSTATRKAKPADRTPPDREHREGDDPWTAATRAPRPPSAEAPASRAGAPVDAPAEAAAAAAQAAARTDATRRADGPDATGRADGPDATRADGPDVIGRADGPAFTARSQRAPAQGDPWAAATRPAERAPAGGAAPTAQPTEPATPAAARPAADREGGDRRGVQRDSAAAVGGAGVRTGETPGSERPAGSGSAGSAADSPRVTGATEVWAAATAANGDTAGDTGMAHSPSVDHDVPGAAPAAAAAEDRGAGPDDDARSGDAE